MTKVAGAEIKVVGKSGQIALGKGFAGKALRVEHGRKGGILLTPGGVVRESQLWTVAEPHRSRIARGLAWAASEPPVETRVEALAKRPLKKASKTRGRAR